jgi:Peptidase_C39 like family
MKTQCPPSVMCCAALFLITLPLMGEAASKKLVLTDAEPQYASKLCWAAADVLAVNQFYPHCPPPTATPAATPALFPTSQALEAAYNLLVSIWGYTYTPTALSGQLPTCESDIGNCNYWGTPPLHGLTSKSGKDFYRNGVHDPDGLDWEAMTQEINNGRPVLFVWDYLSNGTGTTPVGKHELVVIGYSDDTGTQQLQIWDPWPVPMLPPNNQPPSQVPACGPASGVPVTQDHSRRIDFSTYRTPVSDMGVPVTAVHDKDQWDLAIVAPEAPVLTVEAGPPPPLPAPPPFHERPQPPPGALPQLSFAKALSMVLPQSRQLDLQVIGAAPRSLGVPFPIVGLGFVRLLRAGDDPTALLAGKTSAILFPVESQGEVVDAFLMLFMEGRWQRGGYANIEITRRLVDVRARYAAPQHLPLDSFYMVSVPGEVAFFAAHGKGKQAVLIPASTDPSIDAVAGKAVPAERQLKRLILAVRRDLQSHPNRSRNPLRPEQ